MGRIFSIMICIAFCLPLPAYAAQGQMADFIFTAGKQVLPEQFGMLTEQEYKEALTMIRFQPDACWEYVRKDLPYHRDLFRKFDFSGDGAEDLIFSSYCLQEEMRNYFWIREEKTYRYAGAIEGKIIKMLRDRPGAFAAVVSRGRGGGNAASAELYGLQKEKGVISFRLQKKVMEFAGLVVPAIRMDRISFAAGKDNCPLRTSPDIDDDYSPDRSSVEKRPVYGNIIARFGRGARGEAISELKDIHGVRWWFVIMQKDARAASIRFPEGGDAQKAGWMEADHLQVSR